MKPLPLIPFFVPPKDVDPQRPWWHHIPGGVKRSDGSKVAKRDGATVATFHLDGEFTASRFTTLTAAMEFVDEVRPLLMPTLRPGQLWWIEIPALGLADAFHLRRVAGFRVGGNASGTWAFPDLHIGDPPQGWIQFLSGNAKPPASGGTPWIGDAWLIQDPFAPEGAFWTGAH